MLQPFIFSIQRRPYGKWKEIGTTSKRQTSFYARRPEGKRFAPNHLGMRLHPPAPQREMPDPTEGFLKKKYIQVMECALCILLIFRFVTCDERFTNLQSGSLLEIDNIPESWVPQPKRAMFVFWSWTKCLSERSRNSHFCSFLGMEVSDSCSRTVNSFFHSLPIP